MRLDWSLISNKMDNPSVKFYYDILKHRTTSLLLKRGFDVLFSLIMIIVFSPLFLMIAILVKLDSKGPILYKQERVTQYGKKFKVYKFRTMVDKADEIGSHVTLDNDSRVTKLGKKIRDIRIDELPQLFNILQGTMTFVGTRPEAVKYVEKYTEEMMATLLLPAGVTSEASINFKDESKYLQNSLDIDRVYVEEILPRKMEYNLESLKHFSFFNDLKIIIETIFAVLRR